MPTESHDLLDIVMTALGGVWQLLNSNFSAALAGAFAGAFSAAWIVNRIETRRRVLEEIRSTNAAITVAFSITNSYCSLKDQLVRPLKQGFDKQRVDFELFKRARGQGAVTPDELFAYDSDFKKIMPVSVSIEALRHLLFEKVSISGRPLSLVAILTQSIDGLNSSLQSRNEIIAGTISNPPKSADASGARYFGVPDSQGHVDTSYPDTIAAIALQTDDCIFFSKLLADDLFEHGQKLRKEFGAKAPEIHKVGFEKAEQDRLIPDQKPYQDWLNMK